MGTSKETKLNYSHTIEVHNKTAASVVLPLLFAVLHPTSMLDVGCGLGSWLDVAHDLGVEDYLGIDDEHVDTNKLFIPIERLVKHDLTRPIQLGRKFDIAICLEVAEHLPDVASDILIKTLSDHSEIVLFSAAVPGQGGQNHLNEKWLSYWSTKFAKQGYVLYDFLRPLIWNHPNVDIWYKQNIVLFCKGDHMEKILRPLSSPYVDIIHPELFEFYNRQAVRATLFEQGKLGIGLSFSSFIKSVMNKFI